jgi:hypothetical protein
VKYHFPLQKSQSQDAPRGSGQDLEAAGEEGDQGKGDVYCIQPGGTRGCEEVMGKVQQAENSKIQVDVKKVDGISPSESSKSGKIRSKFYQSSVEVSQNNRTRKNRRNLGSTSMIQVPRKNNKKE